MKSEIILATANPHKLQEINSISGKFGIEFGKVDDGFDPVEDGETFEENAYIKAFAAAKMTGKIAFADDTGLCVEKLNGRPGIHSARYAPTQETKIAKLLSELDGVENYERKAFFVCTMVAVAPDGTVLNKTVGKIEGLISETANGGNGFGYDPIFYIPELGKTMAELTEEEKNTISHRARALVPMIEFFKETSYLT